MGDDLLTEDRVRWDGAQYVYWSTGRASGEAWTDAEAWEAMARALRAEHDALRARAEAAEQRAETAERELAQVRAVVESRLAEVSQHDYTMRTLWGSHNKDREVEIRTLQKVLYDIKALGGVS